MPGGVGGCPAPSTSRRRPAPRAGRSSTPTRRCSREGRREYEERMFWFHDGVHWPTPLPPWDATFFEYAMATLSQYNTRHYLIPAGAGDRLPHPARVRLPGAGTAGRRDAGRGARGRVPRAGRLLLRELGRPLRQVAGEGPRRWSARSSRSGSSRCRRRRTSPVIIEGHGTGSGLALVQNYRRLLDLALKLWMHHFEFLNLGYAAYLDFFGFCKRAFPEHPRPVDREDGRRASRSTCSARTTS